MLTEEMRRLVHTERLGFVATVCADGTPNLSPKGTTDVWGDDQLIFADIRSPGTIANLRRNPTVEVNVVDPISRRGFRFKGAGRVVTQGDEFEAIVAHYRARGTMNPIGAIVVIDVERALPLTSPAYDDGSSEAAVRARWAAYYAEVRTERDRTT